MVLYNTKQLEHMLKIGDIYESIQIIQQLDNSERNFRYTFYFIERFFRSYRKNRLKSLARSRSHMKKFRELKEKIRKDLERALPSPQPYLTKGDKKRLKRYQRQQRQLQREARRLKNKISRMSRKMPIFRPKMRKGLQQAVQEMGGASQKLGKGSPRKAFSHQERAASKLSQLRKSMQKAMQRSRGQNDGKGRKGRRIRRKRIKIPNASDHKAPKALREDIIDAMKEKFPQKYKKPVHKYYEKLAK